MFRKWGAVRNGMEPLSVADPLRSELLCRLKHARDSGVQVPGVPLVACQAMSVMRVGSGCVRGGRVAIGKAQLPRSQSLARWGRFNHGESSRRSRPLACWGRSRQQCQHQADPRRIGAVGCTATVPPTSTAPDRLRAPLARTRASARKGYSPFFALALRAFSMICVGESKSSVLALPGATHSSRCLTTMPMFPT